MTEQDAANIPLTQTRAIRAYATAINKRDSAWKRLREYRSDDRACVRRDAVLVGDQRR